MSKKKKEQARLAMEMQRQEQETQRIRRPRVVFRVMNNSGVVPVAKPADFIQLTPVVQPIPLVPYSTQEQPMAEFADEEYDDYE